MIEQIFNVIKEEARNSKIVLIDDSYERVIRIGFNVVESKTQENLPNFYIRDKEKFNKLLSEYIIIALDFYELDETYDNIKKVLTFLWSNITIEEMNSLELYLEKYIKFISDNILFNKNGSKETSLGKLKYEIAKQSIQQETPYCFKSYFEKDNNGEISRFSLPRISYGISDGICYVYAVQNKDSKINSNPKYNLEVKDTINTINSGVKKYRNVTPSFVVALSLFISFLKENGISKIKVETPLPIRQNNRDMVTNYKIELKTMSGELKEETLDVFKEELIKKKLNDDFNSTTKFVNCFNRLKVHFDNIFLSKNELSSGIIVEVINLLTDNSFLQEVVKQDFDRKEERYNGKIS